MSGILRVGLVVLAVFAAAWACAILWWRSSGAAPGGAAMFGWLVLVPLAVLATLWLAVRLRRRARAGSDAEPSVEALPADEETLPDTPPRGVLAQAINLPCGDDAAVLAPRLGELRRPGLHPTLRDRDGLPVLAAFCKELDTTLIEDQVRSGSDRRSPEEHLRALALLEPVALDLFAAAQRLLPPLPEVEERVVAGLRRRVESAPRNSGSVHVLALLPQDMTSTLRDASVGWLHGLAADAGLDPRRSTFEAVAVADAAAVWERIRSLLAGQATNQGDWHLLLTSASLIGERGVQALAAGGGLASGRNVEGMVPGEGAAGVLLRPAGAALLQDSGQTGIELLALRKQAAAEGGTPRQAANATARLLQELLDSAALPAESVAMVLTDADQRPSRSVEAAVAAARACPELDPVAQCPALGNASGYLGHAGPLVLLALAAAAAREADAPVVALSVEPAHMRYAALLGSAAVANEPLSSDAGPKPDPAA
ncbi:hypothetical protein [Luteimonas sp. A478]